MVKPIRASLAYDMVEWLRGDICEIVFGYLASREVRRADFLIAPPTPRELARAWSRGHTKAGVVRLAGDLPSDLARAVKRGVAKARIVSLAEEMRRLLRSR